MADGVSSGEYGASTPSIVIGIAAKTISLITIRFTDLNIFREDHPEIPACFVASPPRTRI
jgi:hypothetical protein